jgi:hypothetical protein
MNSTTPRTRSTPRVALVVALSVVLLFIVVHTAGAQPQPPLSVTLSRPTRDVWDYLSQLTTPAGTLIALVAAIITVSRSVRMWKWTYFTKEWSSLMQFLQPHAKFMDRSLTADYETKFAGDDLMKYEIIARLCIAYLDDLYFLGSKRYIRTWFKGSVRLFAGTHRKWLEDHEGAYDPGFYKFILGELEGC